MLAKPLAGWRKVVIRQTKTKVDFAEVMAESPARAFALASRVGFHDLPKHGGPPRRICDGLNIAENELSGMTRQCVANRRIGDFETSRRETVAWARDVMSNDEPSSGRGDWTMPAANSESFTRKSIYANPKIEMERSTKWAPKNFLTLRPSSGATAL